MPPGPTRGATALSGGLESTYHQVQTGRNVEEVMRACTSGAIAIVFGLCAGLAGAQANDDANNPDKHPNWRGQWYRTLGVQWDASKPPGRGQQAPLTPEYQARYEDMPRPVVDLGSGRSKLWLRSEAERWAALHRERAGGRGRPRRNTA